MLKMVLIPDWVLQAVQRQGAPLETVLDLVSLSSILSPRDVAFYLASIEAIVAHVNSRSAPYAPSYKPLFSAMTRLQAGIFQWPDDEEIPGLSEAARERLLQIEAQYEQMMVEQRDAQHADPDYIRKLTATLWRPPVAAMSGAIPEAELSKVTPYAPAVQLVPIMIKNADTQRRIEMGPGPVERRQPPDRVIVLGAVFSSVGGNETPMKVYEHSYASALTVANQFMPLHQALATSFLDGYMNAAFEERYRPQTAQ